MARTKKATRFQRTIDIIVVTCTLVFFAYVVYQVQNVLVYKWHWSFLPEYIMRWDEETQSLMPNLLLKGLAMTLRLVVWSMILAIIIGVIAGIARTSKRLFPRIVSRLFVEFVRNMPPVVFIFVFYFFISSQIIPLFGIDELSVKSSPETLAVLEFLFGPKELFSNVISGVICLAIFEAAYITEIVRSGIQAIEKGQFEAGQSIGLSPWQVMRRIILPQAVQKVVPPLAGQFITLIKDSSIVSLISIQELTFLAQEVAYSTQYVFEIWIFVALVYFCICYSLAFLFNKLEKRLSLKQI